MSINNIKMVSTQFYEQLESLKIEQKYLILALNEIHYFVYLLTFVDVEILNLREYDIVKSL